MLLAGLALLLDLLRDALAASRAFLFSATRSLLLSADDEDLVAADFSPLPVVLLTCLVAPQLKSSILAYEYKGSMK